MAQDDSVYRLFVDNLSGKVLTVHVRQSYTIEKVFRLIAYKDAKASLNRRVCNGRELLFTDKKISDYKIEADDTIYLLENNSHIFRISVNIRCSNDITFSQDVNAFDTIDHLKQLIYEKIYKDNITTNFYEVNLTFGEKQLDNEKTLSEHDISSNDVISCSLTSGKTLIPIFMTTLTERNIQLYVHGSYTVEHLKLLSYYKTDNPPDRQRLSYARMLLMNKSTLSECGIHNGSVIHTILSVRGGGYPVKEFLFTKVSVDFETRQQSSSPTDPSYKQFHNGVNSEGVCINPKCPVYGEKFVCRHGYGLYRVNEHPTKCPECHETSPRVESFGFSRANVIVRAMPLGLHGQQAEARGNLSEADGDYKSLPYFTLYLSYTTKHYEFIEVFSCPPDCSITLDDEFCSVCSRTLDGSIPCDHGLPDVGSLTL